MPTVCVISHLGVLYVTEGAARAFLKTGDDPLTYLERHFRQDWGELCKEDEDLNRHAMDTGDRLMSVYTLSDHQTKIWIIEYQGDNITLLTPEEY